MRSGYLLRVARALPSRFRASTARQSTRETGRVVPRSRSFSFFSARCHCLDAHDGWVRALFDAYRGRGVQFVMVDSEATASRKTDSAEAKRRVYPFRNPERIAAPGSPARSARNAPRMPLWRTRADAFATAGDSTATESIS